MQVDRNVERFRLLQNRREEGIVEIAAAAMSIDIGAVESELLHTPLEFIGRLVRGLDGQRCKTGQARWVAPDGFGQEIVGVSR